MTLSESGWLPQSIHGAIAFSGVLIMIVFHHSELLGLMDAGLLFGWLPIQLLYDIMYLLVSVVFLYWIAGIMPDSPDETVSVTQTERSVSTEPAENTEG